ncbi:MAG: 3-ketoacyl-CoA thiolase [Deltaproteobacteria bacterium]|nr:3-ketoacyl-CoA thiolase [Deltaproteobacteria bacterium]
MLMPVVTPWNRFYWTAGAEGVLRMQRCGGCGELLFPPGPRCPSCLSDDLLIEDLSGRGTIVGLTVNHQMWHPAMPPPYVIAIVALEEDPAVRLTTNILGCEVDEPELGGAVRVLFEERDDVWLPQFELDPDCEAPRPVGSVPVASRDLQHPPPEFAAHTRGRRFESESVISGIGKSRVGRRLRTEPLGLMVDAALAAIEDAGLSREDIDGISTYPGGDYEQSQGNNGGGVFALDDALRIRPRWFSSGLETSGQSGSVVNAMLAVSAGLCRHVLCVRGVWQGTFSELQRNGEIASDGSRRVGGEMSWRLPYGAMSAANWIGMLAARHMAAFGTTREQLGAIAINARRNAADNPDSIYSDPLTMDDYLGARMVTTPFGLYDCDVPCDGAVALVISHVDTLPDLRRPVVAVEAVGTALCERISWDQGTLLHEPLIQGASRHLWSRTALTPSDVDVAELYDGFTFNCLSWIEALGFCGIGEGGPFLEGGKRIARDGELPLNTDGGQLSAGRLHGYGFLFEACKQLRGEAGARQVAGDPEVALVTTGGGHPGGAWLLTRSR